MAFVARAQGQPERAVHLLGAAEALREQIGAEMSDYERVEYGREVAALQDALDSGKFTALWDRGRMLTMDQAIDYALEPDPI